MRICYLLIPEIDRAFKQFVFESMDLATTDANGFIITRDSEGVVHSAIPWDDPYPFFKGMIPKHEKESVRMSPVSDERSGKGNNFCVLWLEDCGVYLTVWQSIW